MYSSRKKCKNQFPITKWKLCSFNKISFDKNDCNENLVFSWTYWDSARTNKTPESVHFIWRYINETSKALYYVFEFKCSKVMRIKKLVFGHCLLYNILRIFLLKTAITYLGPYGPKKCQFYSTIFLCIENYYLLPGGHTYRGHPSNAGWHSQILAWANPGICQSWLMLGLVR